MNRDINGIIDHLLDEVDDLNKVKDLDREKKIRMTDMLLRNVWKGASLNLQHKKLALRAPEIAQSKEITLQLGNTIETA